MRQVTSIQVSFSVGQTSDLKRRSKNSFCKKFPEGLVKESRLVGVSGALWWACPVRGKGAQEAAGCSLQLHLSVAELADGGSGHKELKGSLEKCG